MSEPAVPSENKGLSPARTVAESLLSLSILEAIPDAVVAVNQQGVMIQVNSQTESLFGYTRDELIGQKIEILVPGAFPPTTQNSTHGIGTRSLWKASRRVGGRGGDQPQPCDNG